MVKQQKNKTYTSKKGKFSARKTNAGLVITINDTGERKYIYPRTRPRLRNKPCGYPKNVQSGFPMSFGPDAAEDLLDCDKTYQKRKRKTEEERKREREMRKPKNIPLYGGNKRAYEVYRDKVMPKWAAIKTKKAPKNVRLYGDKTAYEVYSDKFVKEWKERLAAPKTKKTKRKRSSSSSIASRVKKQRRQRK